MNARLCCCLTALIAAGCPESTPDAPTGPVAAELAPGVKQRPVGEAPSMVMDGAAKNGPVAAGTFSGTIPESELTPQFTQDQLTDGYVVKGTLDCADCPGKLLVRVLPPPPASPDEAADLPDIQLITFQSFDQPGPFEIRVPKTLTTAVLQIVDDANSDGLPSEGERMGMPSTGAVKVAALVEGVKLKVGEFPMMAPMDATGNALAAPTGSPEDALPPGEEPKSAPPPPGEGGPANGATPPAGAPTTP